MAKYAHITGWGMSVPDRILTNAEIAKIVDTNDEWIRSRTGIRERRMAPPGTLTSDLATQAAINALRVANVRPTEVDLIIVSTSSPDQPFPAMANIVQERIGAEDCGGFDLLAACTGFITALDMGAQAIKSGSLDTVVVIGAEVLSRMLDWEDRGTCILFGDGAGAFVLQSSEEPGGIMSTMLRSDGSGKDLLSYKGRETPSLAGFHRVLEQETPYLHMNGREVFRFATRVMARATQHVVEAANLTIDDINLIIPHQANKRIIEAAARGLKLPMDRMVVNVDRYGNTSTASIPLATCEALANGRLHPGDHVVFVGFGAGLTWGAMVAKWTGPFPSERRIRQRRYQFRAKVRSGILRTLRKLDGVFFNGVKKE